VFELEYFGSEYNPDSKKLVESGSPIPRSTSPKRNLDSNGVVIEPYDTKADNIKWSLYMAKVLAGHVKISAQAACDHSRVAQDKGAFKSYNETYNRPADWYAMFKLTFFF